MEEIRDPIHGNILIDHGERRVIEHGFFQRLRNIKQMGFADLAFPGATHNRYAHSLGTLNLAGRAFDSIFGQHPFVDPSAYSRFRKAVRLAALLHDVGHAPFSHVCEFAMPNLSRLAIPLMAGKADRRATHEDYTVKIITDSTLSPLLNAIEPGMGTEHIAGLVNPSIDLNDDFYRDGEINYRPLLCQLVSSELDVDRMDYLRRDSLNSGVGYGHYDGDWININLTLHITEKKEAHLALDPRAIYAFEDFLIARYHMFLMVYFHHKSVIYEELLQRYFEECPGQYQIPHDIEAYMAVDDYHLFSHLRRAKNAWAQRIVNREPYRLLLERHGSGVGIDVDAEIAQLHHEGIHTIEASSRGGLSKYSQPGEKRRKGPTIFVTQKNPSGSTFGVEKVIPLEQCTDLFKRYEAERQIIRIYVQGSDYDRARELLGLKGRSVTYTHDN